MNQIETVCVVGAGFMGWQIALQCAAHGRVVWIRDLTDEVLKGGVANCSREVATRVQAGQITAPDGERILSRINTTTNIAEAASGADLAIEAVRENLELKREVFGELDELCPGHTILATNSSSIRVSAIESATRRPDRVLNAHFYPVPWNRSMVELMRGTATSDETLDRAIEFAYSIGVTPLFVRKENTGFLFNSVWRVIKKECLRLADAGVASAEDIDRAWRICWGTPVGPFGMMDSIGLDVVRDIEMVYYRESGDPSDRPPKMLLDMIERGELGVKSGQGFYAYPNPAYEDPSWLTGCPPGKPKYREM